jgi:hypothetical protein
MAQSVDHQHVDPAQSRQQIAETPIGTCKRQIAE